MPMTRMIFDMERLKEDKLRILAQYVGIVPSGMVKVQAPTRAEFSLKRRSGPRRSSGKKYNIA
jgi:hypothetical protein